MTRTRSLLLVLAAACLGLLLGFVARGLLRQPVAAAPIDTLQPAIAPVQDGAPTRISAHNLLLRKGPQFRIYIRWIAGAMLRTRKATNPSFDDPDSFLLEIEKGVIRANIGDISTFLNDNAPRNGPLKSISLQPVGEQLQLRGTVHKLVSLPIALKGTIAPTPDGRVQFHLLKLDVLKLPVKWLLGGLHIQLADLVPPMSVPGVQVAGDDIFFDTEKLLPPPHIHGRLTAVRVRTPDIELVYGNASTDETELARWHNFLRLSGGTLDFGKLTMHHVDLTMIDASQDPWFDLDLVNYQAQLVNGYTRMTAQAGLEIFMPDLDDHAVKKKAAQAITQEWLRNRSSTLPSDVPVH